MKTISFLVKTTFVCAFVTLLSNCSTPKTTAAAENKPSTWADYYKDARTPDSKLISASPTQTVELVDGLYLQKTFYLDTKTVTATRYFKDPALTQQTGREVKYNDSGIKFFEGNYENNRLQGPATDYDVRRGWKASEKIYDNGKLEGEGTDFDSTGRVVRLWHYHLGELDGESIVYDENGGIKGKSVWKAGEQISSTGPDTDQKMPAYTCNPEFSKYENCGEVSLMRYLQNAVKYPEFAREQNIQGNALVSFVVGKDGSIQNIYVINGVCRSIRQECFRVVSGMPKWTPGYANGEPVKVRFTLPMRFRLE